MPTDAGVRDALRRIVDPEIGVNIVDLGLVYGVAIDRERVRVTMTMTSPACPLLEFLKAEVRAALMSRYPALRSVEIEIVWDPPWHPDMMSDAARSQLDGGG
jgi:metal-sulfur cluster biosynthetic enzyme